MSVNFFKEGVRFRISHSEQVKKWITSACRKNHFQVQTINYIFCSDKYLLKLNKEYLKHNYFTDIITFDNSTEKRIIEADIFISIDRIKENAKKYNASFRDEFHRVMIHGALHLTGYKDKTEMEKNLMRKAEDFWLSKRIFI